MRALLTVIAFIGFLPVSASAQFNLAATFYGDSSNDRFGASVAAAGDVNGDGFADIIVGAPYDDPNGSESGSARVISGADGSILFQFQGAQASHYLGTCVSGAGDMNGDGHDDLVVGLPGHTLTGNNAGACRFFSGADGSIFFTVHGGFAGAYMGRSASTMGDVNGDGFDDVVVGSYGSNSPTGFGRAIIVSGADGSALVTVTSTSTGRLFGLSVSCAGDANGDGVNDFIVGAASEDSGNGYSTGRAYVHSGLDGALLHILDGKDNNDFFGYSVSGAGDVNGDGFGDVIVGAHNADLNGLATRAGSATVFSGFDGSQLFEFWGDAQDDFFGRNVSGAGDVNLDGFADLIVGSPDDDVFGNCGTATVFSGADGSVLALFVGNNIGDDLGSAVSSAGDVDGDGAPDLIIGASGDDNFGGDSGSARLYLSPTVSLQPIGGGQPNSPAASLFVNQVSTGGVAGPFVSTVTRGQYCSLDLHGAPLAFFSVYASYTLNPGGWSFPGYGLFDIGTGPAFNDVFVVMSGFSGPFPFYALDATGSAHLSFFVQPFLAPGVFSNIQAVIQNAQPWSNGVWSTISTAHQIVVQ